MKLLCWNCQGLGTPLIVHALRAITAQERLEVVFFMETKNQDFTVRRISRYLNFQNCYNVNPVGIRGGLALMWKDGISLKVNLSTNEFIDIIKIVTLAPEICVCNVRQSSGTNQ